MLLSRKDTLSPEGPYLTFNCPPSMRSPLSQWRERSGDHVPHQLCDGACLGVRRPDLLFTQFATHFITMLPILIGKELIEPIQVPEIAGPDAGNRIHLVAPGIGRRAGLDAARGCPGGGRVRLQPITAGDPDGAFVGVPGRRPRPNRDGVPATLPAWIPRQLTQHPGHSSLSDLRGST